MQTSGGRRRLYCKCTKATGRAGIRTSSGRRRLQGRSAVLHLYEGVGRAGLRMPGGRRGL
jgi:hypothetical protein